MISPNKALIKSIYEVLTVNLMLEAFPLISWAKQGHCIMNPN